MLRNELVELLGVGEKSLIAGPIEDYLRALALERETSGIEIAACVLRIEEAGPPLRAALVSAAEGEPMTADEATLFLRGLHILGAVRDRPAFPSLLRLLRRPHDELEYRLGDTVTESLPRIAVGMFDGDADSLFAVIADRTVDCFIRDALLMAVAFLTWEGRIDRDRTRGFLQRFHAEPLADDDDIAWSAWLHAIGLLGMRELAPLVSAAWDEGRIPAGFVEPEDFETDLAAAEAAPDDGGRFEEANVGYIADVVESLDGVPHFATLDETASEGAGHADWNDDATQPFDDYPGGRLMDYPTSPYVNPLRNVGRNDPCPCGSGKKYKKCCLAA